MRSVGGIAQLRDRHNESKGDDVRNGAKQQAFDQAVSHRGILSSDVGHGMTNGKEGIPSVFTMQLMCLIVNQSQSTGFLSWAIRYALAFEKGLEPKKPLLALNGEGCALSMTSCLEVSIRAFLLRAKLPQRIKTR